MVNAQEWLDKNYPKKIRSEKKELDISGWDYKIRSEKNNWEKLEGPLDLRDFINLEKLYCSTNELTNLDITGLVNLKEIKCDDNLLTDFDYSVLNPQQLTLLNITDNNLSATDLSVFSQLVNLELLWIGNSDPGKISQGIYNRFHGSLEPLKNLTKLRKVYIANTDIDSGVEYLPSSLSNVYYLSQARPTSKIQEIKEKLDLFLSRDWKNIHPDFTPELRREWENRGFNYESTKRLMGTFAGSKPTDYDYIQWWTGWKEREDKRKKIATDFQLGEEVISQIKDFNFRGYVSNDRLTPEQIRLVEELMPNEELRERYKSYGLCQECQQPKTGIGWCKPCKAKMFQKSFDKWTSGNSEIDRFIQKSQLEANGPNEFLHWIPYKEFTDIEECGEGGFGKVYKAKSGSVPVALKSLNNSQDMTVNFLREITHHKLADKGSIVNIFGISRDPNTRNYLMVMNFIPHGNLRQYLYDNYDKLDFENKLRMLITVAEGLRSIHQQGLVHKDLHPGNILSGTNEKLETIFNYKFIFLITDLGLSRPADEADNSKVYGVLPYVAPEVLQCRPYTQASDVYSFSMIAYEILTGLPPYYDQKNNIYLGWKIRQGTRPQFLIEIPKFLKNTISKCWDSDASERPRISDVCSALYHWTYKELQDNNSEFARQVQETESHNKTLPEKIRFPNYKKHPWTVYYSKLINTNEIARLFQESEKQALEQEIKKIEREISQPLTDELRNLVSDFIQARKITIKDKENETAEDKAWELEDKLKEKGLADENIEKVMKYCERFVKSEQKLEKELQANTEIPTNK